MITAIALVLSVQAAGTPAMPSSRVPLAGNSHTSAKGLGLDIRERSGSAHCISQDRDTITVCGSRRNSYRIDGAVLAGEREAESIPDRLQNLDPNQAEPCVGPNCGGDFLPLVPMAIKIAAAVVDAASGNDWRNDFRTHPDEYSGYVGAKQRHKATFSVGASASSN